MAHTYDVFVEIAASTANPVTKAYTCGAGATVLVLTIAHAGSRTGTPTYNGINLTQADITCGVTECFAELWYLLDPPTGSSYTLSIPNSRAVSIWGVISSYKAQSGYRSVLDVARGDYGTSASPSLAPSASIAGDVMVEVLADGYKDVPSGRTHTSLGTKDWGQYVAAAQYGLIASSGTVTAGFTIASDDWGMVCVLFKEEEIVPPTAPTNAHTISKTATQIVMGWTDNSNNEWNFKLYKNDELIQTIAPGSIQYTFSGLDPNTEYDLAVKAYNGAYSAEAQLTETTLAESGGILFEHQDTDSATEAYVYVYSSLWQLFSPVTSHFVYKVKLILKYHYWIAPWNGTLRVAIYSTLGSVPYPKTELAYATMDANAVSETATEYTFTFNTPVLLLADATYAIHISCPAGSNTNFIGVFGYYNASSDLYTRGKEGVHFTGLSSDYGDLLFYTLDSSDTVHESQASENNYIQAIALDEDFCWQTFTASSAYTLAKVKLTIGKTGSPTGTWKVSLRAQSNDIPTGEDLASVSGDIATAWAASKTLTTFTFSSGYALTSGTKYAIVISITSEGSVNAYGTNYLYIYENWAASPDAYSGGKVGGSTHGAYGNYRDMYFKEYGNGVCRVNIGDVFKYADIGQMQINVGDVWKQILELYVNIGDVWKTII